MTLSGYLSECLDQKVLKPVDTLFQMPLLDPQKAAFGGLGRMAAASGQPQPSALGIGLVFVLKRAFQDHEFLAATVPSPSPQ